MPKAAKLSGTIALTGGSGFVGRHLIEMLTKSGWRVKALFRQPGTAPALPNLVPITGSLENDEALDDLLDGVDVVVHCAGLITARNRTAYDAVNVLGTERLLDAAIRQPAPPRFIHISSLAARQPALSAYAASKQASEEAVIGHSTGLDWLVLRPPVVYGPGDRTTLPIFVQFVRGRAFEPAKPSRFSMIYIDDLAAAILSTLTNAGPKKMIIELDDGRTAGYSWDDLRMAASAHLKRPVKRVIVPVFCLHLASMAQAGFAAVTGGKTLLSQDKIREMLHPDWVSRKNRLSDLTDWRAKVYLEEGVSRTLTWYADQGWL